MKIVGGGGSVETRPRFQSVKDAVVLFDRLGCFWDGAVFGKEKPLESAVSCEGISLGELQQTGLDWKSDEERSEQTSLKCLVDSLSRDLEYLKKEHSRLRHMESEAVRVIANLRYELRGKDDPDRVLISEQELESLRRKAEENGALVEKKLADAAAELEFLRKSESEALTRLELARIELEHVKSAKEAAVKKAKLAETAKAALEEELRGCFLKEREKAALVHASAWAAESENLSGHRRRLLRGGERMPSTGNIIKIRKTRRGPLKGNSLM